MMKATCKLCNSKVELKDAEAGYEMITHLKNFHQDAFAEWIKHLKKYYELE